MLDSSLTMIQSKQLEQPFIYIEGGKKNAVNYCQ